MLGWASRLEWGIAVTILFANPCMRRCALQRITIPRMRLSTWPSSPQPPFLLRLDLVPPVRLTKVPVALALVRQRRSETQRHAFLPLGGSRSVRPDTVLSVGRLQHLDRTERGRMAELG